MALSLLLAEGLLRLFNPYREGTLGSTGPIAIKTHDVYLRLRGEQTFAGVKSPQLFLDPLLGWRSFKAPSPIQRDVTCTLNRQGWRSLYDYGNPKTKPRIIFVGDSLVSYCMLDDKETITHHLQTEFGDRVEIMSMGGPGWGLDQMALAATRIAPEYHPDLLVLSFIQDDLWRGCTDRFFGIRKPYFTLSKGELELKGVPVPTPDQDFAAHQTPGNRFKDLAIFYGLKSMLVRVVGDAILASDFNRCKWELNAELLKEVSRKLPATTKLAIVYLEGADVPAPLLKTIIDLPALYIDARAYTADVSRQLGIRGGRLPFDLHPDSNTNRIYARIIFEKLNSFTSYRIAGMGG